MAEPTATLRQLGDGPAPEEVRDELIAALRHPDAEAFSRCVELGQDSRAQLARSTCLPPPRAPTAPAVLLQGAGAAARGGGPAARGGAGCRRRGGGGRGRGRPAPPQAPVLLVEEHLSALRGQERVPGRSADRPGGDAHSKAASLRLPLPPLPPPCTRHIIQTRVQHDRPSPAIVAELLDGRPHGDEGELLQHFEAEVEASIAQLRQLKAANEGTQGAISDVVAQVRGSWLQSAVACLLVCAG